MTPLAFENVLTGTGAVMRGEIPPQTVFTRIERNSRQVQPGDLFIAVRGERFDGHDFVGDAAAAGATAALVSREWADEHPDAGLPLLVVDEPVAALQRLAAWWRARLQDLLVVGITGSVGKTSTKETVASVLERSMPTYRSAGNLNSEIGLPLSLLEVTPEHGAAVLEMGGAYALGEIRLLAEIAQPRIGVVTNIHPVHLERMGTIEAIAETKAELVDAIPEDGWAILNGDDPRVRAMADRCRGRVLFYGLESRQRRAGHGRRVRRLGRNVVLAPHRRGVQPGQGALDRRPCGRAGPGGHRGRAGHGDGSGRHAPRSRGTGRPGPPPDRPRPQWLATDRRHLQRLDAIGHVRSRVVGGDEPEAGDRGARRHAGAG